MIYAFIRGLFRTLDAFSVHGTGSMCHTVPDVVGINIKTRFRENRWKIVLNASAQQIYGTLLKRRKIVLSIIF